MHIWLAYNYSYSLIMANKVDSDTYEQRIRVCQTDCHLWQPVAQKCAGCGCMMLTKAKWAHAVCPLQKWQS
ncbi:MAG: DUF6171 family protein [Pelagibacteraceae bacterium]